MLVLGTGNIPEGDDDEWKGEISALRMMELLQEHGWTFTYGRDPVLILIEIEEYIENGEFDE
jgi:hypothetical protein